MREVIFDTETTGLSANDGDRVIEIGAVELVNKSRTGRKFHEYLHPGDRAIHPDAQRVHNISIEQLAGKPSFKEVFAKFEDFFGEGVLVAHNAKFDIGFLNAELERINKPVIEYNRVIDTLEISRKKMPGGKHSLDILCDRFGISRTNREIYGHGALLDSELLVDVYIELTGGRQTGFELDHSSGSAERDTKVETVTLGQHKQTQRPKPLPLRLTDEEKLAHAAFLETLGDNPIWKKWL